MSVDKAAATAVAESILAEHLPREWRFAWDNAVRRFGACHYTKRLITISWPLASRNTAEEFVDTVKHEVAHALAGHAAGHGPKWKAVARAIGAEPTRCYGTHVQQPPHRHEAQCVCGITFKRVRRPSGVRCCGKCGSRLAWRTVLHTKEPA